MQGIPNVLQTRADFDLALAMARAGEASTQLVGSHYMGLLEAANNYVFSRALAATEAPDGPMPTYCVIEPTADNPVRRQLKYSVDPAARLFELGFTVAEVQSIVTEMGYK